MRVINELNNTYHFLTIIDESSRRSAYGKLWKCKCVCGKIVHHLGVDLRRGHFQSCGCKRGYNGGPPRVSQVRKLSQHYNSYRSSPRAKELGFTLSLAEFEIICRQNCVYCNAPPQKRRCKYGSTRKGKLWAYDWLSGLDRVDNTVGYVSGNVVPCCGKCNIMKGNSTSADFLRHVRKIMEFSKNKA